MLFSHLHRSKGPAQDFMLVVVMWLVCQFEVKGQDIRKTISTAYDIV